MGCIKDSMLVVLEYISKVVRRTGVPEYKKTGMHKYRSKVLGVNTVAKEYTS